MTSLSARAALKLKVLTLSDTRETSPEDSSSRSGVVSQCIFSSIQCLFVRYAMRDQPSADAPLPHNVGASLD